MKGTRILFVIAVLATISSITACKKDITKTEEYLEVMRIHDIAMAEMGNIHTKSKALKEMLDSVVSIKDSLMYHNALIELEIAEDGMMDWMAGFQLPKDFNKAKGFLDNEMSKVKKVNNDIFTALDKADNIIKSKSENK